LEKLKEISKNEKLNRETKQLKEIVAKITDFIKNNKSNMNRIKPLLEFSKENGYANPTLIDDIKIATRALELIS